MRAYHIPANTFTMCQTWRIYLPFLLLILPTLTAQNPVLPLNPREASLNKSGWRPAKLVEPVPPSVSGKEFGLLRKRQSDKLGSWSLRALTCPAGLTECDSRPKAANGCCPEDMFCVSYAFKRTCCPSGMENLLTSFHHYFYFVYSLHTYESFRGKM